MFQSHLSNYSGRWAEWGKSTGLTLYLFHDPDTGDNTVVQNDHTTDGHNGDVKKALSKQERQCFPGGPVLGILWPTYGTRVQSPGGEDPRCLLARNPEHKTEATL